MYENNDVFKENLLQNARYQMKRVGGKVIVRGRGLDRKVSFYANNGRNCVVWYPTESRYEHIEIGDLQDALQEMSGYPPFHVFGKKVK